MNQVLSNHVPCVLLYRVINGNSRELDLRSTPECSNQPVMGVRTACNLVVINDHSLALLLLLGGSSVNSLV